MNALIQAAAELQAVCVQHDWRFCFIGGLAVQRWGEPRETVDVALTLLAAVERLAELPNLGRPGRLAGTRELVVPGSPYVIPYRVRPQRLDLIAVFHGRQQWPARL